MTDYKEFAQKIKEKYPQYSNIEDEKLARAMIEKYPQYKEKVTFNIETNKLPNVRPKNKGIDITPSGLLDKISSSAASAIFAPFTAMSEKIPLNEAFNKEYQNLQEIKERHNHGIAKILNDTNNFLIDLAAYGKLPMIKGNGLVKGGGAFLGNAAIQGGIPGSLEALKEGNNPVAGGITGAGITAPLMGIPYIGGKIGGGISKLIENPQFQGKLSKALEVLTSVPAEYSERALNKELSGNSILQGKFDSKTAYRPIEEKLTNAKNKLSQRNEDIKSQYKNLGKEIENKYYAETKPQSWYDEQYKNIGDTAAQKYTQKLKPEEYFDVNYKKISDKALKSLEEEKIRRAQAVNEALNNLPENAQFKAADLHNDIQNIVDNYSLSGNPDINYGANAAQSKINQIEDLLYGNGKQRYGEYADSLKNLEFPKSYLETIKGRYKNTYHTKVLDNLNNDIVYAQRNFNTNILDKLRKNPEILQNPQEIEKLEKEVGNYAHFPYDDLNEQFYNKFYEALGKGDILQKGQNFVTPKELYDINKNIGHNMINWDKAGENTANGVLEQVYGKYADRLNNLSPELANANEAYSALMDAQKSAGGIDPRTFGTKLRNYQSGGQIRSGMDKAINELNNMLPAQQKFLPSVNKLQNEYAMQNFLQDNINKGALRNIANFDNLPLKEQNILNSIAGDEINAYKNLSLQQGIENDLYNNINSSFNDISKYDKMPLNSQSALEKFAPDQLSVYKGLSQEQNNINGTLNTIGSAYERNPRLLSNRSDIKFEKALDDLQNRSNISFMDDLNDIRAREALEKWFPGQGGGSGSEQGFGNLLRTAIIGGVPSAAFITHNPAALTGLAAVSPNFTAKGTIKNLGRLNNISKRPLPRNLDKAVYIPAAISAGGGSNLLYGGVNNYEDDISPINIYYGD